MNILIASDNYYPLVNGCAYFTERLALQLQNRGHQVIVLAPAECWGYTRNKINGIDVYGIPSFPVFLYPQFRLCISLLYNRRIAKIFDEFKPDVVHCQFHLGVNRAVMKVAKRKKIPTIGTNHFMPETMLHYLPLYKYLGKWMNQLAWIDFGRVFRQMDQVTTPTQTAADLIAPYVKKNILPISCGIDLERFKPNQEGSYLKEKYSIADKPILLFVGRLDKEKNLDFVLRSAAIALREVDFQLVLAGKGAAEIPLKRLACELAIQDSVTFTGFVADSDLPKLYCLGSCFIMAGTAELQSIATLEAMASGLPVLAVNGVALPELVKEGINGYLFNLDDPIFLAKLIVNVLSDDQLRDAMSTQSKQLIQQHDIHKVMARFEEIYKH